MLTPKKYKAYTMRNFREIPQVGSLSEQELFNIEAVGSVFPFKTNNYVVEELIDWDKAPGDPIYVLNFPQRGMLKDDHYEKITSAISSSTDTKELRKGGLCRRC